MMSSEVEACTRALMEAIRNSVEYRNFEQCREQVRRQPELRKIIDEFRRETYLLQNSNSSLDLADEMKRLYEKRREIRKNKVVSDYLSAEVGICRMLQKISMEVMNVTDLELDGLADVISV